MKERVRRVTRTGRLAHRALSFTGAGAALACVLAACSSAPSSSDPTDGPDAAASANGAGSNGGGASQPGRDGLGDASGPASDASEGGGSLMDAGVDSGVRANGVTVPQDVVDACRALAAASCAWRTACFALRGSADECVAGQFEACIGKATAPGTGWLLDDVAKCTAAVKTQACNAPTPQACIVKGTLAAGSECKWETQCAGGVCNFTVSGMTGRCAEPPAEGAACALDSRGATVCAGSLFCAADRKCHAPAAVGAVCELQSSSCQSGAVCWRGTDNVNRCTLPIAQGAVCFTQRRDNGAVELNMFCAGGLSCTITQTAGVYKYTGTCTARAQLNESCAQQDATGTVLQRACETSLYCDTTQQPNNVLNGVCHARLKEGDDCTGSFKAYACGAGLYCNGKCTKTIALGQPCTGILGECAGAATCVNKVCKRVQALAGEPCDVRGPNVQCIEPLRCVASGAPPAGVCTSPN